ncbi:MAG TPA: hypothetical protein VE842_08885, partial [Pyrinomonadaceae bacterium]|nr:hypothetical protein [Pyrinomonadaceae bacterium]
MSETMNQPVPASVSDTDSGSPLRSYLPAVAAILGSLLMVGLRVQLGGASFISDGALMMLALACYLTAAVFHLMNLYAPSELA